MTDPVIFGLDIDGFEREITITPQLNQSPDGELHPTGVFKITEGNVNMGELVFDDEMKQWEYTGMGPLLIWKRQKLPGTYVIP